MYKRGSIVLVPFPFSDLSGQKIRPALVLSTNKKPADVVVVFITSKFKPNSKMAVSVKPTKYNGLKAVSTVVCDKIATLDVKIIIGQIGSLEETTINSVAIKIKQILGL